MSVYDEAKKLIGIFDVEVSYDISRLTNELKRRFPRSRLRASSVNGRIMLSGEVADAGLEGGHVSHGCTSAEAWYTNR